MDAPYIRVIQRKNGKIIIRAMLELEKVTFESIVGKVCEDYNIFIDKKSVETAVRGFLIQGMSLGFLDSNSDGTFFIDHSISNKPQQMQPEKRKASDSCLQPTTPSKRHKSSKK